MPVWSSAARGARSHAWLMPLLAATFFAAVGTLASGPGQPSPSTLDNEITRQRADCMSVLGVERWHKMGFRGQGCKIAILDNSFRGYRDYVGQGLPAQILTKSFRKDGNLEARDSQHGVLCTEVVHALAPDAQLFLANWEPDDPASFLEAVRWAKAQGARIISCSLIMPNWSDGEGGGQVHEALGRILGAGTSARDLLFFASAGNTAMRHWTGAFDPNEKGLHQWGPGRTWNLLTPWGTDRVAVEIYGATKTACELQVWEESTGALVGKMALQPDIKLNWGQAVVRFDPRPGQDYLIRLKCAPKGNADKFHLVVLGGNLEDYSPGGSIPFPGDGAGVMAVGAVDLTGKRLNYSSCGPNSSQPKPDFVGMIPFPSSVRQRPFAGTSAAAPQAAALAALCWARYPQWTPRQICSSFKEVALDLCSPGHDCETGYGLIRLP